MGANAGFSVLADRAPNDARRSGPSVVASAANEPDPAPNPDAVEDALGSVKDVKTPGATGRAEDGSGGSAAGAARASIGTP